MMKPLNNSTRLAIASALLIPGMALVWVIAVPGTLAPSTFAILSAVLAAFAGIAWKTYHDGQAEGSIGQLIHETDVAAVSTPAKASAATAHPRTRA